MGLIKDFITGKIDNNKFLFNIQDEDMTTEISISKELFDIDEDTNKLSYEDRVSMVLQYCNYDRELAEAILQTISSKDIYTIVSEDSIFNGIVKPIMLNTNNYFDCITTLLIDSILPNFSKVYQDNIVMSLASYGNLDEMNIWSVKDLFKPYINEMIDNRKCSKSAIISLLNDMVKKGEDISSVDWFGLSKRSLDIHMINAFYKYLIKEVVIVNKDNFFNLARLVSCNEDIRNDFYQLSKYRADYEKKNDKEKILYLEELKNRK